MGCTGKAQVEGMLEGLYEHLSVLMLDSVTHSLHLAICKCDLQNHLTYKMPEHEAATSCLPHSDNNLQLHTQ